MKENLITKWEKKNDEFGVEGMSIMTYQRSQSQTSTDIIRAECCMRGITLQDIEKFNQNYHEYAKQVEKWISVQNYIILEKDENQQVDYLLYGMPDPYSNRDAVIATRIYRPDDSTILKVRKSIPKIDVPVLSGIERCSFYHAVQCKQDHNDIILTDIFSIDLKGYLP